MDKAQQLKRYKKIQLHGVPISREMRDIIHGYVMSDGYLSPQGILQVDQSLAQEKFVEWMYEKLKPICTEYGPQEVRRPDSRVSKGYTSSKRFNTRTLLEGFAYMWYKEVLDIKGTKRRKVLPKSIACFFSKTFITLWFAGDGTKETHYRGAKIEVTAFTPEERLLLQRLFKSKYNISTKINKAGESTADRQQWVLQIPAAEYDKFYNIITEIDLLPTLFPHKLHKKPQ
jgi:hypothetical protein